MKNIQKGFTLIELLVVIAIIGLLASIVLVAVNAVRARSRDLARVATVDQLRSDLQVYYSSNNAYPVGTYYSGWDNGSYPGSNGHCWCQSTSTAGTLQADLISGGYISQLPEDPITKKAMATSSATAGYGYVYVSDGQSYVLGTYLEASGTVPPTTNTIRTRARQRATTR